MSTPQEDVAYERLESKLKSLEERGRRLRERELKVSQKVLQLLALYRQSQNSSSNISENFLVLKNKYQELQQRERKLLDQPFVQPQDIQKFQELQNYLDGVIQTICEFEDQSRKVRESFETAFSAEKQPNGKFMFSITKPTFDE